MDEIIELGSVIETTRGGIGNFFESVLPTVDSFDPVFPTTFVEQDQGSRTADVRPK